MKNQEDLKEKIVDLIQKNYLVGDAKVCADQILELFGQEKQRCIDKIKEKGVAVHRLNVIVGYFIHLKDLENN